MEMGESRLFAQFSNMDITDDYGESACQSHDYVDFEFPKMSSVHEKTPADLLLFLSDEDGDTVLHVSIIQEDHVKSAHIISHSPDFVFLSLQNNLGQTPAHLGVITNSGRIVRKLVCAGSDITCQDREGNTPLHHACAHGYLDCARQLLTPIHYAETLQNSYALPFKRIPQNLSVKNYDGLTCLHLAVMQGHTEIVRVLLDAGAEVTIGDSKSGRTALHMAAEQGRLDTVALLLAHTREVDSPNYQGYTPVQLAYSRGHIEVVELFLKHGASADRFQFEDGLEDSSDCFDVD